MCSLAAYVAQFRLDEGLTVYLHRASVDRERWTLAAKVTVTTATFRESIPGFGIASAIAALMRQSGHPQ